MQKDLHILPKLRDSLSFLYVEHAVLEQENLSIVMIKKEGRTPIPIAAMTVLMIGPGVSITHAAIKTICDCGCTVVWCGESAAKFYASGMGETRSAKNLLRQAECLMDEEKHMEVVRRMYLRRFPNIPCENMSLQQIRGMEGIRVREAYRAAAKSYGVSWSKRDYKQSEWDATDPINRALSSANAILYSVCQAAITSLGYSTGLGFIHTGKMLSFVYDIADLYKADTTIPAAFSAVKAASGDLDRQIRMACRCEFTRIHLLKKIPQDLDWIFQINTSSEEIMVEDPGELWNGEEGNVAGGKNYAADMI